MQTASEQSAAEQLSFFTDFLICLRRVGLDFDPEALADVLWLARYQPAPQSTKPGSDSTADGQTATPPKSPTGSEKPGTSTTTGSKPGAPTSPKPDDGKLYTGHYSTTGGRRASAIQVPAASALPGALELSRALRPFNRRRPSNTRFELDEEATAESVAQFKFLRPVLRPMPERWFNVALLVDGARSMDPWAKTIEELHWMLARHGAFDQVRRWRMLVGDEVMLENASGVSTRPASLIDPRRRTLLLLVTNGVAEYWNSNLIASALAEWSNWAPIGVIQVFGERQWPHTALGTANSFVRAPLPGAVNAKLDVEWKRWQRPLAEGSFVVVPMVPLAPEPIARWAETAMSVGINHAPAVMFLPGAVPSEEEKDEQVQLTPTQQVERFRSLATQDAFRLACYLAAVPLTLPVMRIVQQEFVLSPRVEDLAQVIASGLLERVTPAEERVDPDMVIYDFRSGVRDLLLGLLRMGTALEVKRKVESQLKNFIERQLGRSIENFRAFVLDESGPYELPASAQALVKIERDLLQRFGFRGTGTITVPSPVLHGKAKNPRSVLVIRGPLPAQRAAAAAIERGLADAGHAVVRDIVTAPDVVLVLVADIQNNLLARDAEGEANAVLIEVNIDGDLPNGIDFTDTARWQASFETLLARIDELTLFKQVSPKLSRRLLHGKAKVSRSVLVIRGQRWPQREAAAALERGLAGAGHMIVQDLVPAPEVILVLNYDYTNNKIARGTERSGKSVLVEVNVEGDLPNGIDFTDTAGWQTSFEVLLARIDELTSLGRLIDVPELPEFYWRRPELDEIRHAFSTYRAVLLRGVGGETAAAGFAREPDTRRLFSGGIYWHASEYPTGSGKMLLIDPAPQLHEKLRPEDRMLMVDVTSEITGRLVRLPSLNEAQQREYLAADGFPSALHNCPALGNVDLLSRWKRILHTFGLDRVEAWLKGRTVPCSYGAQAFEFAEACLIGLLPESAARELRTIARSGYAVITPSQPAYEVARSLGLLRADGALRRRVLGALQSRMYETPEPPKATPPDPVRISCSYNDADSPIFEALVEYLKPLADAGEIQLPVATKFPSSLQDVVNTEILLLLLSKSMPLNELSSLGASVRGPKLEKPVIVPIFLEGNQLRQWQLIGIQGLPRDGIPLMQQPDLRSAYLEIAKEIGQLAASLRARREPREDRPDLTALSVAFTEIAATEGYYKLLQKCYQDRARGPQWEAIYWTLLSSISDERVLWQKYFSEVLEQTRIVIEPQVDDPAWHQAMWYVATWLNTGTDAVRPLIGLFETRPELSETLQANSWDSVTSRVACYYAFQIHPKLERAKEIVTLFRKRDEELRHGRALLPWLEAVSWISERVTDSGTIEVTRQTLQFVDEAWTANRLNQSDVAEACRYQIEQKILPWLSLAELANKVRDGWEAGRSSAARTKQLDDIAESMQKVHGALEAADYRRLVAEEEIGRRLIAYARLVEMPDPSLVHETMAALAEENSNFGQYWALIAIESMLRIGGSLNDAERTRLQGLNSFLDEKSHRKQVLKRILELDAGHDRRAPKDVPDQFIWVVGTGAKELTEQETWVAEALGTQLARTGFGLIGGGWPGVDQLVAMEFARERHEQGLSVENGLTHLLLSGRAQASFPEGKVITPGSYREHLTQAAELASGAVLIGGAGATYEAYQTAMTYGKPAYPIGATEGDAELAFNDLVARGLFSSTDILAHPIKSKEDARRVVMSVIDRLLASEAFVQAGEMFTLDIAVPHALRVGEPFPVNILLHRADAPGLLNAPSIDLRRGPPLRLVSETDSTTSQVYELAIEAPECEPSEAQKSFVIAPQNRVQEFILSPRSGGLITATVRLLRGGVTIYSRVLRVGVDPPPTAAA
jgi:hypothetical protein